MGEVQLIASRFQRRDQINREAKSGSKSGIATAKTKLAVDLNDEEWRVAYAKERIRQSTSMDLRPIAPSSSSQSQPRS